MKDGPHRHSRRVTRVLAIVAAGWSAAALGQAADPAQCTALGVTVQVLGSGGPELQDRRASASYLIRVDGVGRVLIDAGGGSALRFGESGAAVGDLAVVLLTHLHVDHTGDLPALVMSSYFEDRTAELPIYGPAGNARFPATTALIRALFGARAGAYPYLSAFIDDRGEASYRLRAHDVPSVGGKIRRIYQLGDIRVQATAVVHGDVPALAYRVDVGDRSVVLAGDGNGDNGNLERLARGADVLIAHNAVPEGATGVERALHMPPSVIGRIAGSAGVGQLVVSHRMQRTLGREAATERAIRASYSGPVAFADDLDCFAVRARAR